MCFNCGCFNPDDDMGSPDDIKNNTLTHLSEHWNTTLPETKQRVLAMIESGNITDSHVSEMLEKAAKAWGQSVDEAKKNAKELLKSEVG